MSNDALRDGHGESLPNRDWMPAACTDSREAMARQPFGHPPRPPECMAFSVLHWGFVCHSLLLSHAFTSCSVGAHMKRRSHTVSSMLFVPRAARRPTTIRLFEAAAVLVAVIRPQQPHCPSGPPTSCAMEIWQPHRQHLCGRRRQPPRKRHGRRPLHQRRQVRQLHLGGRPLYKRRQVGHCAGGNTGSAVAINPIVHHGPNPCGSATSAMGVGLRSHGKAGVTVTSSHTASAKVVARGTSVAGHTSSTAAVGLCTRGDTGSVAHIRPTIPPAPRPPLRPAWPTQAGSPTAGAALLARWT